MDDVKQRQDTSLDWMDKPIESNRWRIVCFAKDGKYDVSTEAVDTEAKAAEWAKQMTAQIRADTHYWECDDGTEIYKPNFSHFLVVPAK